MNFSELDRAARIAAAKAPAILRPDIYQDAWIKFLRYAPVTFGGAYLMAHHAAINLFRRERTQLHRELIDVIEEVDTDDTAALIAGLRALCPEETEALLLYYSKDKPSGAERIRAMRQRIIIKKRLKGE